MSAEDFLRAHRDGLAKMGGPAALPPIEDPRWNPTAEAIGEALLHERAQLPTVILGQCEIDEHAVARPQWIGHPRVRRCPREGMLVARVEDPRLFASPDAASAPDVFLCPRHGATLERAVRRWPR